MKREIWREYVDFTNELPVLPSIQPNQYREKQDTVTIEKVVEENEKLKKQYAKLQSDYVVLLEKYNKLVSDF